MSHLPKDAEFLYLFGDTNIARYELWSDPEVTQYWTVTRFKVATVSPSIRALAPDQARDMVNRSEDYKKDKEVNE